MHTFSNVRYKCVYRCLEQTFRIYCKSIKKEKLKYDSDINSQIF